ncbi:MAG: phosphopantetheine-binding protein [Oscillospiraceae bacterium]|nr:phosphopantetheine-binding protein [Oscillospiraceae bacterium]
MQTEITEIICGICGAEDGELEPDLELFDAGLLDSFAVVQMLVEFEGRLGISLDIETLRREDISTPAKIIGLLGGVA